jgi:hypothetical protein
MRASTNKKEVDKLLREKTFEWAKVAFYRDEKDPSGKLLEQSPFHDDIANTMFWMWAWRE